MRLGNGHERLDSHRLGHRPRPPTGWAVPEAGAEAVDAAAFVLRDVESEPLVAAPRQGGEVEKDLGTKEYGRGHKGP